MIYFILYVTILIVTIDEMMCILYKFQLNGYDRKSIFDTMSFRCKRGICYWLFYVIILISYLLLQIDEYWILFLALILVSTILILLGEKFGSIHKIVYTRRMIRLIVVATLLSVIECILYVYYVWLYLAIILLPLFLIVAYFNIYITSILLLPIEYLIGEYYIKKAKKKIAGNKKLIKIGITGSFGKTSTKEILSSVLGVEYSVLTTPKSFNTPFGITKTINDSLINNHEYFLCEMGAKKKGEIKYLCEMIGIDVGIVTSVGRQHMNTFGSLENIYKTKKELPDYLFGKMCVFNLMNVYTRKMYFDFVGKKIGVFLYKNNDSIFCKGVLKSYIRYRVYYGKINYTTYYPFLKKNNYYAKKIICTQDGSYFDIYYNGNFLLKAMTSLVGMHNIINILLAVAVASELGEKCKNIAIGISKLKSIGARLEKILLPSGAVVLNNGYNSNIDSARFSLDTLKLFNKNNKVVITPGLVETNDDDKYNYEFGRLVGEVATSVVIVKEKNRDAILKGLMDIGYDICSIRCVDTFADAKKIIDVASDDYVFLIENDLPDNYN